MKRTFLYLATILAAACASAETLTPAQALARVNGSRQTADAPRRMASRALVDASPALTVSNHGEDAELYMFTPADGGMLLVSAESETPALIGYSDRFIPGAELPPALQMMLESYAAEIAAVRAGDVIYGNDVSASRAADDLPAIAPLCSTKWNQDAPYSDMCPKINGSPCVTGCVATAMAQVLKVYEYPAKCTGGTLSYEWKTGGTTLSLNFDKVTLDWANMTDTYSSVSSSASCDAVATLMKALGYSAWMDYSPYASGTTGLRMAAGLVSNFDYDCTLGHYSRCWFTRPQWQKMIYDVLASGYPVYYDGATADGVTGGHAFVVDGYRGDNYFHLNWGWGGMSDGYFLLTALDPGMQGIGGASAGFDRDQGAILGLKKGRTTASADAPYIFCLEKGFRANVSSATLGSLVSFSYTGEYNYMYNMGPTTAAGVLPAVKLTKSDGTVYNLYSSGYLSTDVPSLYGIDPPRKVLIPSSLTEGKYTVTPAVYNTSSKTFYDVYYPIGQGGSFEAEVIGDKINFGASVPATMTASDLKAPATIYTGKVFTLSGKLSCVVDSYHGPVKACLYSEDMKNKRADLGAFVIDVEPGENAAFSAELVLTDKLIGSGKYEIALFDQNDISIFDGTTAVTLSAPDTAGKLRASGLTCTSTTREKLAFEVSLTASDGNFKGPVYIPVHNRGDYTDYVVLLQSPTVEIKNGETKTISVSGAFDEGVVGNPYTAYVYYDLGEERIEASGRQRLNFTLTDAAQDAIDAVEAGSADGKVEFFDLSGRRVAAPGKGIYIMRKGTQTSKVRL